MVTALASLEDVLAADAFGRRKASELAGQLLGTGNGAHRFKGNGRVRLPVWRTRWTSLAFFLLRSGSSSGT